MLLFAITRVGNGKMVEEGEEKARAARLPAGGFNVPLRNFVGPINTGWPGKLQLPKAGMRLGLLRSRAAPEAKQVPRRGRIRNEAMQMDVYDLRTDEYKGIPGRRNLLCVELRRSPPQSCRNSLAKLMTRRSRPMTRRKMPR